MAGWWRRRGIDPERRGGGRVAQKARDFNKRPTVRGETLQSSVRSTGAAKKRARGNPTGPFQALHGPGGTTLGKRVSKQGRTGALTPRDPPHVFTQAADRLLAWTTAQRRNGPGGAWRTGGRGFLPRASGAWTALPWDRASGIGAPRLEQPRATPHIDKGRRREPGGEPDAPGASPATKFARPGRPCPRGAPTRPRPANTGCCKWTWASAHPLDFPGPRPVPRRRIGPPSGSFCLEGLNFRNLVFLFSASRGAANAGGGRSSLTASSAPAG